MNLRSFFTEAFFSKGLSDEELKKQKEDLLLFVDDFYRNEKAVYFDIWRDAKIKDKVTTNINLKLIEEFRGKLNDDTKPELGYLTNPSPEFEILKKQISNVINALKSWCVQEKIDHADKWDLLVTSMFHHVWLSDSSAVVMLADGKRLLEELLFNITKPNANKFVARRVMQNLCPQLTVCAPGVYTNLQIAVSEFSLNKDLICRDVRLKLIQQRALTFAKNISNPPRVGREIHYVNGFTNYVADKYAIPIIEDEFVDSCNITPAELEKFKSSLDSYKVIEDFFEALADRYEAEIRGVEKYTDAEQFAKTLEKLGDDPDYLTLSMFQGWRIEGDKCVTSDDEYEKLKPKDEVYAADGKLCCSNADLLEQIRLSAFMRLYNSGYINRDNFIPIQMAASLDVIQFVSVPSKVSMECSPLSFVVKGDTEVIPRRVFLPSYFENLDADMQFEVLNLFSDLAAPSFIYPLSLVAKPNVMSRFFNESNVNKKILFFFALNGNQEALHAVIPEGIKPEDALAYCIGECVERNIELKENIFDNIKITRKNFTDLYQKGVRNFSKADFTAADLTDLKDVNFSELNFSGAIFFNTKLPKDQIQLACTNRAKLDNSSFKFLLNQYCNTFNGFDMRSLSITQDTFEGLDFKNCNFQGVNFTKLTAFNGCSFDNVNLENANMHNVVIYQAPRGNKRYQHLRLVGAYLRNMSSNCILQHVTLDKKSLVSAYPILRRFIRSVILEGEDFTNINFAEYVLIRGSIISNNARFDGSSFKNARMDRDFLNSLYKLGVRDFNGIILKELKVGESVFNYHNSDLSELNLSNANFSGATLCGNFKNSNLRGANFTNVIFEGNLNFEGTIYEGYNTHYIKYSTGIPLSTCKVLLQSVYLMDSFFGRLFTAGINKPHIQDVTTVIDHLNRNLFNSVLEVQGYFEKQLKLKNVPMHPELKDILNFCLNMEERFQPQKTANNVVPVPRP